MDNRLYAKVFGWLFAGLMLTFGTGAVLANYEEGILTLLSGTSYIIVIVVELFLAFFLSARIHKMSRGMAIFCYLLYSFVTGVTFSIFFLAFSLQTLFLVFGITALVFGLFAVIGAMTKLPLNKLGSFLFIGLVAILIAGLVNIFLGSSMFDFILCIIGTIIFIGYIAYDMKKLPVLLTELGDEKGAVYGAFQLYLDFINLFIRLLQLFGGNDRD